MSKDVPSDGGGHSGLASLLKESEDELIGHWISGVADAIASQALDVSALENSMRHFIWHLRERLLDGSYERVESAEEHGKQRQRIGFHVAGMAREYGLLLGSVLHIAERKGIHLSMAEYGALSRHVVDGIAEATAAFVEEQHQARTEQANHHFAFIAHELRSPLQNMTLALDAWLHGLNEGRVRAIMQDSLGTIGELIDASLIDAQQRALLETGLPEPQCTTFDLVELARMIIDTSAPHGELHGISLVIDAPDTLEVSLDARLLRSILTNLIGNAIKFSRGKGATVTVRLSEPKSGRVHIEVQDECGGLPKGAAERMFAAFAQLGADRSGFGLGLAIVRQAVEGQSGTIQVHDVPNEGCVFVVDLPMCYTKTP